MNNFLFLSSIPVYVDIFLLGFFFFTIITCFWWFAPWVPTRKEDLELIAKIAKLKKGETFYELGCGDGRVSFYMAEKFPKNQIVGLEIFFPVFLVAKIKQLFWGKKNLSIKFQNIFWQDLSKADVLYVYGMPDSLEKDLRKKFLKDLKPKSRIISYVFKMKKWHTKAKINHSEKNLAKIYTYTV